MWDKAGSSSNPCDEIFRGEAAGDAPETKALMANLADIKSQQGLKLYIDWHSYSQLMMWGMHNARPPVLPSSHAFAASRPDVFFS